MGILSTVHWVPCFSYTGELCWLFHDILSINNLRFRHTTSSFFFFSFQNKTDGTRYSATSVRWWTEALKCLLCISADRFICKTVTQSLKDARWEDVFSFCFYKCTFLGLSCLFFTLYRKQRVGATQSKIKIKKYCTNQRVSKVKQSSIN